jgi:hypothetical protein
MEALVGTNFAFFLICSFSFIASIAFDVARQECKMQRINTEKASLKDRKPHRDTHIHTP